MHSFEAGTVVLFGLIYVGVIKVALAYLGRRSFAQLEKCIDDILSRNPSRETRVFLARLISLALHGAGRNFLARPVANFMGLSAHLFKEVRGVLDTTSQTSRARHPTELSARETERLYKLFAQVDLCAHPLAATLAAVLALPALLAAAVAAPFVIGSKFSLAVWHRLLRRTTRELFVRDAELFPN